LPNGSSGRVRLIRLWIRIGKSYQQGKASEDRRSLGSPGIKERSNLGANSVVGFGLIVGDGGLLLESELLHRFFVELPQSREKIGQSRRLPSLERLLDRLFGSVCRILNRDRSQSKHRRRQRRPGQRGFRDRILKWRRALLFLRQNRVEVHED